MRLASRSVSARRELTARTHPSRLCFIADKYAVVSVARAVLDADGCYFLSDFSPEILALGLFFRMPALVTTTLRASDYACEEGKPPCVIDDIPWRLLRLLPPSTFVRLAVEHSRRYCQEWSSMCHNIQSVSSGAAPRETCAVQLTT